MKEFTGWTHGSCDQDSLLSTLVQSCVTPRYDSLRQPSVRFCCCKITRSDMRAGERKNAKCVLVMPSVRRFAHEPNVPRHDKRHALIMQRYFTYLLRFEDGSYYTGVTNNIDRRVREHRTCLHLDSYVSRKGSFCVVHVETFKWILDAIRREKQIQSWSRAKKDALVLGDENVMFYLAKKQFRVRPSAPSRSEGRTEA